MIYELLVLGACFIANAVATVSGFGVGTVLTPTLLWFFPAKETILLVCIVHLFHDAAKTFFFRRFVNIPLTIDFSIAAVCAAGISSFILASYSLPNFSLIFGIFLLLYATFLFFNPEIYLKKSWRAITLGGIASGFIAGLFGIFGTIRSTFLLSFKLEKKSYAGTSGAISFLINSMRLLVYWYGGLTLYNNALTLLPFLIIVSLIGTFLGKYLVHIIPVELFQKIVLLFIISAAIHLIMVP